MKRESFPKNLESAFEILAYRYVGRAYDLKRHGHYVTGNVSLSRYSKNILSLFPEFKVKANPSHLMNDFFICFGESVVSGSHSYRSALATRLEERGTRISDEVIDRVFRPIDYELMKFYRQVFPLECVEGTVIDAFDTELVDRFSLRKLGRFVTLYTIEDVRGMFYHVGLKGIQYPLEVGDRVRATFDRHNVLAPHLSQTLPYVGTPPDPSKLVYPDRLRVASFFRLFDYQQIEPTPHLLSTNSLV